MVCQHFISKVNNNIDKVPFPLLHYGLLHWQLVIDLWTKLSFALLTKRHLTDNITFISYLNAQLLIR